MAMKSFLRQSLFVILCGYGLLVSARAATDEDLVARVNGEPIRRSVFELSKSYLDKELQRRFTRDKLKQELARQEREILRTLIDERVLKQRAETLGIVPEVEVIKHLDQMRLENGLNDLESLERSFVAKGIDPKQFKHDLEQRLLKGQLLRIDAKHLTVGKPSSDLSPRGNSSSSQSLPRYYIQRLRRSSTIEVKHGFTDTGVAYTNDVNQDLLIAARIGDTLKVHALVAQGANPNIVAENGYSALMHAAEMGHVDTVEALLDGGVEPNVTNSSGDTALILATIEGYKDIVKTLLAKGADPNVRDGDGVTPLIRASLNCNTEIVHALLERQADVNSDDNNGRTALIAATAERCGGAVTMLLSQEADPNLTDRDGRTALIYGIESGRTDLTKALLQRGARVDARDSGGKTALIYAVLSGQPSTLRQLLSGPVDVNVTDNESQTPLMYAAAGGSEPMVQMLLDAGADTKAETWSAYLTRYNSLGLPHIVPEVEPQPLSSPLTALEIAKQTGQDAIVALLSRITE